MDAMAYLADFCLDLVMTTMENLSPFCPFVGVLGVSWSFLLGWDCAYEASPLSSDSPLPEPHLTIKWKPHFHFFSKEKDKSTPVHGIWASLENRAWPWHRGGQICHLWAPGVWRWCPGLSVTHLVSQTDLAEGDPCLPHSRKEAWGVMIGARQWLLTYLWFINKGYIIIIIIIK